MPSALLVQSLWLVANQENAWAMEDLIANVPEAERHSPVLIDQDKFAAMSTAQSHMLSNITEAPSTGFIGKNLAIMLSLCMLLQCMQASCRSPSSHQLSTSIEIVLEQSILL